MKKKPAIIVGGLLFAVAAQAQGIVEEWRYTVRKPADGWQTAAFDDSSWQKGFGGFGERSTPGARVGTTWRTRNIWLRKSVKVSAVPAKPALLIHHDEGAEVFINGVQVGAFKGYVSKYRVVPIQSAKRSAIKKGFNAIAVHCSQTVGGQFIDVHLVDADKVPELPKPKRGTKPFVSKLITKWGAEVTAENVWTEYPRPQMRRDNWTNLNGKWDYAITPAKQQTGPKQWKGKILVPFSLESRLSGVQRLLGEEEALWYRRTFQAEPDPNKRLLLNFEAVDYRCEAFVNGKSVGKHQGGNTPFSFDVTGALKSGRNELVVRAEDDTEEFQLRGKQTLTPRGIWYTQVSGIWQTVWLEEVPATWIERLKMEASMDGSINLIAYPSGVVSVPQEYEAVVSLDGREIARTTSDAPSMSLQIPRPKLWSPELPTLYDLEIRLNDDVVRSYVGIREVGKAKDTEGHWRFTLNGKPVFHWGPLDQGWWPDGLLTPPSDEAMVWEVGWLKEAGFNMIRKHIKVEPRRFYYHCDRLGMMVWQDHVSGGPKPKWTRLRPDPEDAQWPDEKHEQFMLELNRMITKLETHPSIVSWVPFNEAWGQHRTMEVGQWTSKRDPSRLNNIASGGNFWPIGDVLDHHAYPHPTFPFELGKGGRFDGFIKVMGEFGGHGYPVKGHLWDADRRNWGYGGLPKNEAEYKKRYVLSIEMLNELRAKGIAGGVYTQTTDVEGEINGLMTYDRKVVKIPARELAEIHKQLFDAAR